VKNCPKILIESIFANLLSVYVLGCFSACWESLGFLGGYSEFGSERPVFFDETDKAPYGQVFSAPKIAKQI
jgi:hypothetical protein